MPPNAGYCSFSCVDEVEAEILCREASAKDFMLRNQVDHEILLLDMNIGPTAKEPDDRSYIELLRWLEATGRNYPIRIHAEDCQEKREMLEICMRNGWTIQENVEYLHFYEVTPRHCNQLSPLFAGGTPCGGDLVYAQSQKDARRLWERYHYDGVQELKGTIFLKGQDYPYKNVICERKYHLRNDW